MIYTSNFNLAKFTGQDKVKMLPFNDNFAKIDTAMYDAAETMTEDSEKLYVIGEQIASLTQQTEAAKRTMIQEQAKANATDAIIADVKRFNTEHATDIDDLDALNDTTISGTNSLNVKYNEYIKFCFGIVNGNYGYYKGSTFVAFP